MHTVRCPACLADVGVAEDDFGHPVTCPLCGDVFTPTRPGEPAAPPDRPSRRRPRFEDDEDDDYDRRRYRRRRYDPEEADEAVRGPANGLFWTGLIGAALHAVGGVVCVVVGLVRMNDPNVPPDEPVNNVVAGTLVVAIGGPYFGVIAAGGRQLKRLDGGTGLVYTAAVLGIATLATCGPCWPTTLPAVAFGIWALVAVSKPEVQAVLEAARGG
jgi:hypothetical protein